MLRFNFNRCTSHPDLYRSASDINNKLATSAKLLLFHNVQFISMFLVFVSIRLLRPSCGSFVRQVHLNLKVAGGLIKCLVITISRPKACVASLSEALTLRCRFAPFSRTPSDIPGCWTVPWIMTPETGRIPLLSVSYGFYC